MSELVPWRSITPEEASKMTDFSHVDLPVNEIGEVCPWPWDPQQLVGAPLGQYHCPYCGGMQMAGVPHLDFRDVDDEGPDPVEFRG